MYSPCCVPQPMAPTLLLLLLLHYCKLPGRVVAMPARTPTI